MFQERGPSAKRPPDALTFGGRTRVKHREALTDRCHLEPHALGGQAARLTNGDGARWCPRRRAGGFHRRHHPLALEHLTKDHVLAVEGRRGSCGDEKLRRGEGGEERPAPADRIYRAAIDAHVLLFPRASIAKLASTDTWCWEEAWTPQSVCSEESPYWG